MLNWLSVSLINNLKFKEFKYGIIEIDDLNWTIVDITKIKKDNNFDLTVFNRINKLNFNKSNNIEKNKFLICFLDNELIKKGKGKKISIEENLKEFIDKLFKKHKFNLIKPNKLGKKLWIKYRKLNNKRQLILEEKLSDFQNLINLIEKSCFNKYNNVDYVDLDYKVVIKDKFYKENKFEHFKKNSHNITMTKWIPSKKSIFGQDILFSENEYNSVYKNYYKLFCKEDINLIKDFLKENKLATLIPNITYSNLNPLHICLKSANDNFFFDFINLLSSYENYNSYNLNLGNKIVNIYTGENSKHTYGYETRTVQLSRNNKVGNMIFNKDNIVIKKNNITVDNVNSYQFGVKKKKYRYYSHSLGGNNIDFNNYFDNNLLNDISKYITCINRFKHLCNSFINFENDCIANFNLFIENGNFIIAEYLSEVGFKRSFFGFNKYFKPCINGQIDDLNDIKISNIRKKLNINSGFLLINASFINPNKNIPLLLLEKLLDFNIKDNYNRGLLFYSAISPHIEIFDFLIKKGLNINEVDKDFISVLMMACIKNNYKVVEHILSLKLANVNFKNKKGYCAIHYCARYNSLECLKLLWEYSETKIKLKGPKGKCIVTLASKYGNNKILEFIINKAKTKFNLSSKDKFGMTPLMYSIMTYNNDCLNTLLINGADYNMTDSSGNNLFHYVAGFSNLECIKTLIEINVDPNLRNIWNFNSLNIAYLKGNFSFFYEILKFDNINVNLIDNKGKTIISNIIEDVNEVNLNFLKLIIKQNLVEINKQDINKYTPLHYLSYINVDKIKNLHNYHKINDIDKIKEHEKNIKNIYTQYFELIYEKNAINIKNNDNKTIIAICIENNNNFLLKLLIKKINIINSNAFNKSIYDCWKENEYGNSIFSNLIKNFNKKNFKILKSLINNKLISNNEIDKNGNTFMHYLANINIESFINITNKRDVSYEYYLENKKNMKNLYNEYFNWLFNINFVNNKNISNCHIIENALKISNIYFIKLWMKNGNVYLDGFEMKYIINNLIFYKNGIDIFKFLIKNNNSFKEYVYSIDSLKYVPTFNLIKNISKNWENKINNYCEIKKSINILKLGIERSEYSTQDWLKNYNIIKKIYLNNFKFILKEMLTEYNNIGIINIKRTDLKDKFIVQIQEKEDEVKLNYKYEYKKSKKNNYKIKKFRQYHKNNIFHILFNNFNLEIINLLIDEFDLFKYSNYLNYFNFKKRSPFEIFLLNDGFNLDILKELIDNGANINIKSNNKGYLINKLYKDSNFHYIINYIKNNHKEYFNTIDFNLYDKNKENAILYFIKNYSLQNIDLIYDKIDINSQDIENKTPLINAIILSKNNDLKLLKKILYHKDTNFKLLDIFKRNFMHYLFIMSSINKIMCSQIFTIISKFVNEDIFLQEDIYWNTCYHYYFMSDNNLLNNEIINKGNSFILKNNKYNLNILLLALLFKNSSISILTIENCNFDFNKNIVSVIDNIQYDNIILKKFMLNHLNNYNKSIYCNLFSKLKNICCEYFDENYDYIENNIQVLKDSDIIKDLREDSESKESEENEESDEYEESSEESLEFEKSIEELEKNKLENKLNNMIAYLSDNNSNEIDKSLLRNYNVFQISLILKNYEFCYKLLSKGYSLYKAIIDCIKIKDTIYAVNLIDNKDSDKENINIYDENILTCLTIYLDNHNDELYELILKNYDNLFIRDNLKRNAFHYAIKCLNLTKMSKLMVYFENDENLKEKDIFNNNYLSIFIQSFLKKKLFVFDTNYDDEAYKLSPYQFIIDYLITDLKENLKFNFFFQKNKYSNCLVECYKYNLNKYCPELFDKILNLSDINLKNYKDENIISLAIINNDIDLLVKLIKIDDFCPSVLINNNSYIYLALKYNSFVFNVKFSIIKNLLPYCSKYLTNNEIQYISYLTKSNKKYFNLFKNIINYNSKITLPKFIYDVENSKYLKYNLNIEKDFEIQLKKIRKLKEENIKYTERKLLDFRCENEGVIEKYKNKILNFYMVKIDLKKGFYSQYVYYKMQFYYDPICCTYNLFTNWGRINEDGQFQITPFKIRQDGIKELKKIYNNLTGNDLEEDYEPKYKRYKLLNLINNSIKKIDINFNDLFDLTDKKIKKSNLNKTWFKIVNSLTNFRLIHQKYLNLNLNKTKLDIFDINKEILDRAKDILKDIKINIEECEKIKLKNDYNDIDNYYNEIMKNSELSSKFYEIFPIYTNDYSIDPINSINKLENIKTKIKEAKKIEKSLKIIIAAENQKYKINPVDYIFFNLNCKISKLNKKNEEYLLLYRFINDSSNNKIDINKLDIYSFENEFEKNKKLDITKKRKLLFHGTRHENLLNIFKSGLLNNLKESSKSGGQQLGNGLYLSDAFEKSINFSNSRYNNSYNNSNKYMLICEVELGKMYKTVETYNLKKDEISKNYDSIKCYGKNYRKDKLNTIDNISIPFGKLNKREFINCEKLNKDFIIEEIIPKNTIDISILNRNFNNNNNNNSNIIHSSRFGFVNNALNLNNNMINNNNFSNTVSISNINNNLFNNNSINNMFNNNSTNNMFNKKSNNNMLMENNLEQDVNKEKRINLEYNEYLIYNDKKVKIKYLVKIN